MLKQFWSTDYATEFKKLVLPVCAEPEWVLQRWGREGGVYEKFGSHFMSLRKHVQQWPKNVHCKCPPCLRSIEYP